LIYAASSEASCRLGGTSGEAAPDYFSIGADAEMRSGTGSPFNPDATKKYAGNPGNPATNPNAVS